MSGEGLPNCKVVAGKDNVGIVFAEFVDAVEEARSFEVEPAVGGCEEEDELNVDIAVT